MTIDAGTLPIYACARSAHTSNAHSHAKRERSRTAVLRHQNTMSVRQLDTLLKSRAYFLPFRSFGIESCLIGERSGMAVAFPQVPTLVTTSCDAGITATA